MKTFSLSTLMTSVAIVAILLCVSRFGFWSCIAAWAILGSLALTTIPSLMNGTPRWVFVMFGAIGGVCGCWLGSRIYSASSETPTEFLTLFEYNQLYWRQRKLFIAAMLCLTLLGGMIGLGRSSVSVRN